MELADENKSLLMIIDVQEKLVNAVFNKEILLKKAEVLSKASEILDLPVIVTEQYPKGLGETVEFVKNFVPKSTVFCEKTDFSALNNGEILSFIERTGKKQIVIFGIETHICVNHTVYDLIKNGYEVFLVKDACGSRDESEHNAGIELMNKYGANIVTTETILFELLRTSKHDKFKEIQKLIK